VAYERFGGELPLGCDPLAPSPSPLPGNVLAFSHGRAALSWLAAARGPFASAALCAYTCPTVPAHLARLGLALGFFDYGDADIAETVAALPGRCLVVVPAPFGLLPWVDAAALAGALGAGCTVVVDAAQTAFGALDLPLPPGGAVLSCPRKTAALGDGALLALDGCRDEDRAAVDALPTAEAAARAKQAARALFAAGKTGCERDALALARRGEALLPPEPRRMSDESRRGLARIDRESHRARRRRNAMRLAERLAGRAEFAWRGPFARPPAVPYDFPILHADRARLLADLGARRVFATPLWPDAVHDRARHPHAADLVRRLVALPVDQRYGDAEMDRLAELVRQCL
jgi:hypothetical protein